MTELEIYGGATADYLSKYRKRRFPTREAAERYADKVAAYLDELGVRAAHPMRLTGRKGRWKR